MNRIKLLKILTPLAIIVMIVVYPFLYPVEPTGVSPTEWEVLIEMLKFILYIFVFSLLVGLFLFLGKDKEEKQDDSL